MTHYSRAQKPDDLWANAQVYAKLLKEHCKKHNVVPVICYQGMSGVASATALMLALRQEDRGLFFIMFYARKEEETNNHSYARHEWEFVGGDVPPANRDWIAVFVDDLISSGATRGRVRNETEKGLRGNYGVRDNIHRSHPIMWDSRSVSIEMNYINRGLKIGSG